ncbi:MAG TPA: hypothetical protein VL983_11335, partial [Terriglobales bacterium]|nr:hypothetical protein [Terriglobales bacterium]
MKPLRHLLVSILVPAALTVATWAQTNSQPTSQPQTSVSAADIQALKEGLAAALKQIHELQNDLRSRDQAVQQAQTTAA